MAGSDTSGGVAAPPWNGGAKKRGPKLGLIFGVAVAFAALMWAFPLFHVVRLKSATSVAPDATAPAAFDPVAAAAKFWQSELPAAASRARELAPLAASLRDDAANARTRFGHAAGLGTAYFFVRGSGTVVARERNAVHIAVAGTKEIVALRIGPIFGNTVRDGCGLLDVNAFPGLQEFNALSAELNQLVERKVLPALRDKAVVGATVQFVGCAEAPESAPDAGEPLLVIVPVQAEVR
ncbi:DUF2291 family protein [Horticoccus sp. 23ND18S-11]|uniref:DUF2291 family protein n=1 Tax=Horticoccus sp. 23ND18S-11 TaxID=3391832 RepID=UPI0039C9B17D